MEAVRNEKSLEFWGMSKITIEEEMAFGIVLKGRED